MSLTAANILSTCGIALMAVFLCAFFVHLRKLSPDEHLAFRKQSKPGKIVNLVVIAPLIAAFFLGPEDWRPVLLLVMAVAASVSIPIQHISLARLGFDRRWVFVHSAIAVLSVLGLLCFAGAFANGFSI